MAMKDRMHTGALYLPGDDEIMDRQRLCLDRLYEFNHTRPTETDKRQALMKEMFAELGENCYIEPPFYSNFGGAHVHLGNHVYCNFAVTMVDDTLIYIGDNTMIAPNVTIGCCRSCGSTTTNTICRCILAIPAGSAPEQSSCPGSPSATIQSSAPGPSLPKTFPPM